MARAMAAVLLAAVLITTWGGVAEARRRPQADKKRGGNSSSVKAPQPAPAEPAAPPVPQGYSGVSLKGDGEPPGSQPPPAGLQAVTWPGFRADDQGSEVFLQMTGRVSTTQKVRGRRLIITLEKTVVPLRNNLRPVITRGFRSPVSSFRLRRVRGNRVQLEISLRRKVAPSISWAQREKFNFLVVAFPPAAAAAP